VTAILTPVNGGSAKRAEGKRLWRKQLLPVGKINYKGETVDFSQEYLAELVRSFNSGAYDQVPFQLADGENKHTQLPERFHGEVRAIELTPEGLDIVVAATKAGHEVLSTNPRLGISARIVESLTHARDGKSFSSAIQHVLGTLDPVVTGMTPWRAIEASRTDADGTTIDLSNTQFEGAADAAPGQENDDMALTDAQQKNLEKLLNLDPEKLDSIIAGADTQRVTDEDLDRLLAEIENDETDGGDGDGDGDEDGEGDGDGSETGAKAPQKVTATLSQADRARLELANSAAAESREGFLALRQQLDSKDYEAERTAIARKYGIPPYIVDLARPALEGTGRVISLSNGDTADVGPMFRRTYEEIGKLVRLLDLGSELGQALDLSNDGEGQQAETRVTERTALVSTLLNGNYGLK
jgi:hypothetical protein